LITLPNRLLVEPSAPVQTKPVGIQVPK